MPPYRGNVLARAITHALVGLEARRVEVEVHLQEQVPAFTIVGLADRACQEAKERVRSGVRSAACVWPRAKITVNLAPAGLRKEGSAFDESILDPNSPAAKAAKAAKQAEAEKAKAEKAAKEAAKEADAAKAPSEAELRRRLDKRREHLTGVRDELGEQLDVKKQGQALLESANQKIQEGREFAAARFAGVSF